MRFSGPCARRWGGLISVVDGAVLPDRQRRSQDVAGGGPHRHGLLNPGSDHLPGMTSEPIVSFHGCVGRQHGGILQQAVPATGAPFLNVLGTPARAPAQAQTCVAPQVSLVREAPRVVDDRDEDRADHGAEPGDREQVCVDRRATDPL